MAATNEPAGARFVIDRIRHATTEVNSLRRPSAADVETLAALAQLAVDAIDWREVPIPDTPRVRHWRPHDADSAVACVWSAVDLTRALAAMPEGGTLPAASTEAIRHEMRSLCAAIDYAVTRHKEATL